MKVLPIFKINRKNLYFSLIKTYKILYRHNTNFNNNNSNMVSRSSIPLLISDELNLSYSGCGFLGMYHVGVASCFHQYAPQLSMHKMTGTSVGCVVACAHICGNPQLALTTHEILRIAIKARSTMLGPFHPSFDINKTLWEALDRGMPPDCHKRASGKLHISLTRVRDGKNIIINEFDTREDLMQLIICSCFIPFWSGLIPPIYKGEAYIDGGFSNNLPRLDKHTVTVSPFSGESDICPLDISHNLIQVTMANMSFLLSADNIYKVKCALLPPSPKILSQLCQQGFEDGIRFLQKTNRISCTRCINVRQERGLHTLVDINEESIKEEDEDNDNEENDEKNNLNQSDRIGFEDVQRDYFYSKDQHIVLKRQSSLPLNRIREDEDDGFAEGDEEFLIDVSARVSVIPEEFKTWPASCQESRRRYNRTSNQKKSKDINNPNNSSPTTNSHEGKANNIASSARSITRATFSELMHKIRNNCDDCQERRKTAMFDSLPEHFVQLIQDACHQLEQQLSPGSNITIDAKKSDEYLSYRYQLVRFCYSQPWKTLIITPWLSPIKVSLLIVNSLVKQIPQLSQELSVKLYNLITFLHTVVTDFEKCKTMSPLEKLSPEALLVIKALYQRLSP